VTGYLIVLAVVFGANLLPVFGPPTWALLVFFRLSSHLMPIPLVIVGAIAAVSGRLLLAMAFRHLRGRLSTTQSNNLQAAGKLLHRDRKRSVLGLGLFALSPVPSAQLFEAAGLMGVALAPLTIAFFAGRLVSYSLYVAGASAAKNTGIGTLLRSSFTSPWGIALQVLLLGGIVGLTRIDWARHLARHDEAAESPRASAPGGVKARQRRRVDRS
jgi:uncharacterized membrane protein YdjX (TVP38/TMEM64 family)